LHIGKAVWSFIKGLKSGNSTVLLVLDPLLIASFIILSQADAALIIKVHSQVRYQLNICLIHDLQTIILK